MHFPLCNTNSGGDNPPPGEPDPGEQPPGPPACPDPADDGDSFSGNTGVLLADGKTVPISTLKPGDIVLGVDLKTGRTEEETVVAVLVHHDTDLYDLRVKIGSQVAIIHTTSSHLFWDATTGQWMKAASLQYGTRLRVASGMAVIILGGYVPATSSGEMWDLTILADHDFYIVVGNTSVLVHNEGGPYWRGYKPGEEITFTGRAGIDYKVNRETGLVSPGKGPSITTDPAKLGKYGRIGAEVDISTIPGELEIIQRGNDPDHYEIVVPKGVSMTEDELQGLLGQIQTLPGC